MDSMFDPASFTATPNLAMLFATSPAITAVV
jgi:hypothetical protein